MNIDISSFVGIAAGAITALSGIWASYRHIKYSRQAKKDRERQEILDKARLEVERVKEILETKINRVEVELAGQKESVARDFFYMKETYNNEIKGLGEKIEDLRQQLNAQHSQLIGFLTKLIENK